MQKGIVRCPICAAPGAVLAKYPERVTENQHWYAFKMLKCSQGHFFTLSDKVVGLETKPGRYVVTGRKRLKVANA
jgi:hypothetical protein